MVLDATRLETLAIAADLKSFTMPYAMMSKSDSPREETFVSLSGREVRRACLAFR